MCTRSVSRAAARHNVVRCAEPRSVASYNVASPGPASRPRPAVSSTGADAAASLVMFIKNILMTRMQY